MLNLLNDANLIVIGCYRPPSASFKATTLLSDILHSFPDSEFILLGNLNWDWLSISLNALKDICGILNDPKNFGS